MLRRTVEVLRQIPAAYGVPPALARAAGQAADAMDRFPVADAESTPRESGPVSTAGRGFGPGFGSVSGLVDDGAAGMGEAGLGDELQDGFTFEGDDDVEEEEDEKDERQLFPWKAGGLKGDRNALQDIDQFEAMDLDRLLGLGKDDGVAQLDDLMDAVRGRPGNADSELEDEELSELAGDEKEEGEE